MGKRGTSVMCAELGILYTKNAMISTTMLKSCADELSVQLSKLNKKRSSHEYTAAGKQCEKPECILVVCILELKLGQKLSLQNNSMYNYRVIALPKLPVIFFSVKGSNSKMSFRNISQIGKIKENRRPQKEILMDR